MGSSSFTAEELGGRSIIILSEYPNLFSPYWVTPELGFSGGGLR
jgi:hypothetical protein